MQFGTDFCLPIFSSGAGGEGGTRDSSARAQAWWCSLFRVGFWGELRRCKPEELRGGLGAAFFCFVPGGKRVARPARKGKGRSEGGGSVVLVIRRRIRLCVCLFCLFFPTLDSAWIRHGFGMDSARNLPLFPPFLLLPLREEGRNDWCRGGGSSFSERTEQWTVFVHARQGWARLGQGQGQGQGQAHTALRLI